MTRIQTHPRLPTGLVLDNFFTRHDPTFCPDRPERVAAIERGLTSAGLFERCVRIPLRDATDEEITLIHSAGYLDIVKESIADGLAELPTGDTDLCEFSLDVARRATGSVLNAIALVLTGEVQNAFCAVRPPGHHATPPRGMGFCIFNHIAIAARYAQKIHGLGRIAILDWDVHHGNGTQDAFYEDPTVLFFSSHQYPLYPGTGRRNETGSGPGEGFTINAPLPAGSGYEEILHELESRLEPALHVFKPELILISAGFDAHIADPLGDFTLETEHFSLLTKRVMQYAQTHCQSRLVSVLEGGYNLRALGDATAAHVATLCEW